MKAQYRSANGRLTFAIEGSPKSVFEQIALLQDIFEVDDKCGQCNSTRIRFRVRAAKNKAGKDIKYYELRCLDCWAQFDFGVHQAPADDILFPKSRENGQVIGVRGWYKYNGGRPQQQNGEESDWQSS